MQRPTRFKRADIFPADWQDTVCEFLELFHFHRYQYIYRPHGADSWLSAKEDWRLTDTEILKAVGAIHPKYLLGFRFGKQTRFAVLDIDAGSPYHNQRSYQKLKRIFKDAGLLPPAPFRSSDSGGWHLYIFFNEFVNSTQLRSALSDLLTYTGFRIKSGELEIFPNVSQASSGMGLRLPLQPGFAFLNDNNLETTTERWELSATNALDFFLDAASASTNTFAQFQKLRQYAAQCAEKFQKQTALRTQPRTSSNVVALPKLQVPKAGQHLDDVAQIFSHVPPGMRTDDWFRGREYYANGLTGPSQRANAIYCLSHYFFYGDPSQSLPALGYGYETERELAIKQILELRNNGFSKDLNRGDNDATAQIERAANWLPPQRRNEEPKKYTVVQPIAWIRENANRKLDARKRIQAALEKLTEAKKSFTTIDLQKNAECSRTTLYKHEDIWRQAYEELAQGFFAACTHEYNGVEGGGSSETTPQPLLAKKESPPGLLAARRIVYELKMRDSRQKRKRDLVLSDMLSIRDRFWHDELKKVQSFDCALLSPDELRLSIVLLQNLRATAPDEDLQHEAEVLLRRFLAQEKICHRPRLIDRTLKTSASLDI